MKDIEEKISAWDISWDGYYPYCKNCCYEPDWNIGVTEYCPNCNSKMLNYREMYQLQEQGRCNSKKEVN